MKTILFGAVAAVAVMTAASVANAQDFTTGYVGASYSVINSGVAGSPSSCSSSCTLPIDDASVISARAVGSFQLDEGFEVQVDGDIASVDIGYPHSSSVTVWGPTIHAFMETKGGSKLGAILGYEDADNRSILSYGLEGRFAATDNISFGAAALWGSQNLPTKPSTPRLVTYNNEVRAYDGEVSYFVNDNFRIDAGINNYRVGNTNPLSVPQPRPPLPLVPSPKVTVNTYRIGGELQLENLPVAFTFGYANIKLSNSNYDSYNFGVRHSFGGSLKDRDRTSSPFHGAMELFGGAYGLFNTGTSTECIDNRIEDSSDNSCDVSRTPSQQST